MKMYLYIFLLTVLTLNLSVKALNDEGQEEHRIGSRPLLTGLFCNEYHNKPPKVVQKAFVQSLGESVGGLVIFHFPLLVPVVNGDPNQPQENAVGYKIHGPSFSESYRTFNRDTSFKAWGVALFLHGLYHSFRSGSEMLNILAEVEHRAPESQRREVDKHIKLFLRGGMDVVLAYSVYSFHQAMKTICPGIEDDITAEDVGGTYYITHVLSSAFLLKSVGPLIIGGIGLMQDGFNWLYRRRH